MVAADARAKRDGRFIEKIGTYNPNTNPATIEIQHDRALYWLGVGAQPTDTARAILKQTGAIYHTHLLKGVAKGALTEAQATKKFEAWFNEKQSKVDAQSAAIVSKDAQQAADALAAEKKINEARKVSIASAASEMAAAAAAATMAAEAISSGLPTFTLYPDGHNQKNEFYDHLIKYENMRYIKRLNFKDDLTSNNYDSAISETIIQIRSNLKKNILEKINI